MAKKFGYLIALFIGALLGVVSTAIWFGETRSDHNSTSPQAIPPEHTKLFNELTKRVSRDLVAVSTFGRPTYTAKFYQQPLPYGDVLCRVRTYSFDPSIVRGPRENLFSNALEVNDEFGVWLNAKTPTPGYDRDTACRNFREFDLLVTGEGSAVHRGVVVLDQLIAKAKLGKPDVQVTCEDSRGSGPPVRCDGEAVLRSISVRDIRAVVERGGPLSDHDPDLPIPGTRTYKDELAIRVGKADKGCGSHERLNFIIVSDETDSAPPAPRSVAVSRGTIC